MIELGKSYDLPVVKRLDFGAYVDAGELGEVLLPKREIPRPCRVGQLINVFLYLDSEDRPIATTQTPLIRVGECARLKVIDVNSVGVFMDWGLPKNIMVPHGEARQNMTVGRSYMVIAYIDKRGRICATPRLHKHFSDTEHDYTEGKAVSLIISARTEMGYKAVIDETCMGLLHSSDTLGPLRVGDTIDGYIKFVRDDGKIDLCLSLNDEASRDDLGTRILEFLKENGGSCTITDKSPPRDILAQFGVSKKQYKKVLGGLYKRHLIAFGAGKILLK